MNRIKHVADNIKIVIVLLMFMVVWLFAQQMTILSFISIKALNLVGTIYIVAIPIITIIGSFVKSDGIRCALKIVSCIICSTIFMLNFSIASVILSILSFVWVTAYVIRYYYSKEITRNSDKCNIGIILQFFIMYSSCMYI